MPRFNPPSSPALALTQRLFLCEKPSQARDIAQVLSATWQRNGYLEGAQCRVTWCLGHLLEMVMPEAYHPQWKSWRWQTLPILPNEWQLAVRQEVSQQFQIIQKLLTACREVVLATDADREGETIGREILQQCAYRGRVTRLWLSALDETSIRKALQALRPGEQSEPLYYAGIGRARADWLVGINLSRAYTLLGRSLGYDGVLSVGRVQTPTLKLVVDRDRHIEQFQPVSYHEVWADLHSRHGPLRAQWQPEPEQTDSEGRCVQRPLAEQVVERVQRAAGVVQSAQTKRVKEAPPLPLDLSTLQQEGSRRWSLGAGHTLQIAQALYETHKIITYPRTDCRYLPSSQWAEASRILHTLGTNDPTLAPLLAQAQPSLRSRAWDDGRITAHHAMIPTGIAYPLNRLTAEERRVYDLIQRHYLAQFFPAYEYDQSVIELLLAGCRFRASGRVSRMAGWKTVMHGDSGKKNSEQEEKEHPLPPLQRGDAVTVAAATLLDKQSKPPERFSEGTLIQAMKQVGKEVENPRLRQILRETAGIGTEATRAAIIDTLLKRQLLLQEGKNRLISSAAGRLLVDLLPHSVTDAATTAVWEQALEDIAQGEGSLQAFQEKVVLWVNRLIEQVKLRSQATESLPLFTPGPPPAQRQVPDRPSPARLRRSKSVTPSTAKSKQQSSPQESQQRESCCPLCRQGNLVKRLAGRGKQAGSHFWGCSRYPACRYTHPCDQQK
ncbi:MAG: DNA topoisomerase 3 [Magnetococcales bacterium]|nr:DNA topoisomerase 3 [Magnetococcales bacterium]